MTRNKQDALARFSKSREELLKNLDGLTDTDCTGPQVEGIWTIKDLIGHISAWEITFLTPLQAYLAGNSFCPEYIPDHDSWNADRARERDKVPMQEVLEEMVSIREQILGLVGALSDEQWSEVLSAPWGSQETLWQMIDGLAWHEEEHTSSIQKYKKQYHK